MAESPLLSVVITNYNYARFVPQAVESVLAQTYRYFELVIVDDGSTDNSREVLETYRSRATLVFKENGGQGSAFNAALSQTHGQFICLLDADDTWEPEKLQRVAEVAAACPRAVLIQHQVQSVTSDDSALGPPWPQALLKGDLAEVLARSGGYWPCPPTSGLTFSRSALERLLPMPEQDWRICADAYLVGLAPLLGEVESIPEPLTRYRVHGGNYWVTASNAAENDPAAHAREAKAIEARFLALSRAASELRLPWLASLSENFSLQFHRAVLGSGEALGLLLRMAISPPPFVGRFDALKAPVSALRRRWRMHV